jgi:hypothetical protein
MHSRQADYCSLARLLKALMIVDLICSCSVVVLLLLLLSLLLLLLLLSLLLLLFAAFFLCTKERA